MSTAWSREVDEILGTHKIGGLIHEYRLVV